MSPYRAYLFDLDGTLFRGSTALPGAVEVLTELRRRGASIRFLTNNSSQTRDDFVRKLTGMGFEAHPAETYGSAFGTAQYCRHEGIRSVFTVSEVGLVKTFRQLGIEVVNWSEDAEPSDVTDLNAHYPTPDAVVAGICRHFNYHLMNVAMQQIRKGARFIATNPDVTYPMEGDTLIPGAGSIVAAITACSEQEPFVVGKPNPFLVQLVLEDAGIPASEALVVGDRMDTDIESGRRAGCPTYLVLTGVTKEPPEGQPFGKTLEPLLS